MRVSTAMLVVACLAIATVPRHAAAQESYYPAPGQEEVYPTEPYAEYSPSSPRAWGSAELLLGFRRSRQVPALVTTNPTGTLVDDVGILSNPSTTVLFGGGGLEDNPKLGVRGEAGLWLDQNADCGVGVSYLGLEEESIAFSRTSDGSAGSEILSRPYYDPLFARDAAQLVSYPNLVRGNVDVVSENNVYSAEIFLRKEIGLWTLRSPLLLGCLGARSLFALPGTQVVSIYEHNRGGGGGDAGGVSRCDFIAGYQYSRIDDSLRVSNHLTSLDPSYLIQVGTTLDAFDSFSTRNDFHGGTLGLKLVSSYGPWSLSMLGKVGLGNMHQKVDIDGRTVIVVPNGPTFTSHSGLLTQESNIGAYARDRFAVVPEARITLNYSVTRCLSVGVGYHFIYWDRVAVAADQVDTNVDTTQTFAAPTFAFRESDFFVHAVTFLAQLNY
jgi:hypothetical protein